MQQNLYQAAMHIGRVYAELLVPELCQVVKIVRPDYSDFESDHFVSHPICLFLVASHRFLFGRISSHLQITFEKSLMVG